MIASSHLHLAFHKKGTKELKADLTPLDVLNNRHQHRLTELQELARNNN
jgi:hypothetical protein